MEDGANMRKKPLLEFKGAMLSVNIILDEKDVETLKDVWENRVEGCQPPLVDGSRNGLLIHIPWVLKKTED